MFSNGAVNDGATAVVFRDVVGSLFIAQRDDDQVSVESGEIVDQAEEQEKVVEGLDQVVEVVENGRVTVTDNGSKQQKVLEKSGGGGGGSNVEVKGVVNKGRNEGMRDVELLQQGNKEQAVKVIKGNPPLVERSRDHRRQRPIESESQYPPSNGRVLKRSRSRSPSRERSRYPKSKTADAIEPPSAAYRGERKRSRSRDDIRDKDKRKKRRSDKERSRSDRDKDKEREKEKERRERDKDRKREKRRRSGGSAKERHPEAVSGDDEKEQGVNMDWDWDPEKAEQEEEERIREMRQRRQQLVSQPKPVSPQPSSPIPVSNGSPINLTSDINQSALSDNSSDQAKQQSHANISGNLAVDTNHTTIEQSYQQQSSQLNENVNGGDCEVEDNGSEEGVTSIAESDEDSQRGLCERIDIFQNVKEEDPLKALSLQNAEAISSKPNEEVEVEVEQKHHQNGIETDDMFSDMFAEETEPKKQQQNGKPGSIDMAMARVQQNRALADAYDDEEGYYRFQVGEILNERYEVRGESGKGVFSTVLKAIDRQRSVEVSSKEAERTGKTREYREVAIKVLRNNDSMRKAGDQERVFLQRLHKRDPEGKKHCIKLLSSFTYRGHLCLVFEALDINLRKLNDKVGGGQGIRISMVREYAAQLLLSLLLLKRCNIIHADIKPDNILVNERRSKVKLCDFGSALESESAQNPNNLTPYLVSRFYRAPEVILGMPCDFAVDMWSLGCVLYELFTGKILFRGRTNNAMLKCMMDIKGPFAKKMLKKAIFVNKHFAQDTAGSFISCDEDPVTRKPIKKLISNPKASQSFADLVKGNDGEKEVTGQFCDLLEKMMMLDPEKRITPEEAQRHPFVRPIFQRGNNPNSNVISGKK